MYKRQPEADIRIKREEISRRHAELVLEDQKLIVADLRSANGTFVNGRRIRRAGLKPGDEIRFDTERFIVQGADTQLERTNAVSPRWSWKMLLFIILASLIAVAAWQVV